MALIEYVLRQDADTKPGGDIEQAKKYAELAVSQGHVTAISVGRPQRPDANIRHLFNVDRPSELLRNLKASDGKPVVISSIHHSHQHLAAFYRKRRGLLGHAERALPRPLVEFGKDALRRARVDHRLDARVSTLPLSRNIRLGLERATAVLVLARGEAGWLKQDFGYTGPSIVIPNGSDLEIGTTARVGQPKYDVIVVGRVEERKNQLAVARALSGTGLRTIFVGRPNPTSRSYVDDFASVVANDSALSWLPGTTRAGVAELLVSSRVSVSASYFEVLSLGDLEAAAAGCQVIASEAGNTAEYLTHGAQYVSPTRVESELLPLISRALTHERSGHNPKPSRVPLPTWSQVGDRLGEVYSSVR
ncbi:glycosyltransferase [Modestobacter sp. SYSU DS0290]